jgi:succinate-semialdehyde dehydrogenase/glutarate-semialdehyde dehydrogenase
MNNKLFKTFDVISSEALNRQVETSYNCFMYNQGLGGSVLGKKCKKLAALGSLLHENTDFYANLITKETGKLVLNAREEIGKCIHHLEWLIENSEKVIKDEEYRLMNG